MIKECISPGGQTYWVTSARYLAFPEPGETTPLEEFLEDPEPATMLGIVGNVRDLDIQALRAAFPQVRVNESSGVVAAWGIGHTSNASEPERGLEVYVRFRPGPGGIQRVVFPPITIDMVSFPVGEELDPREVEQIMTSLEPSMR